MLAFSSSLHWMPPRVSPALFSTFALVWLLAGCSTSPRQTLPAARAPTAWKEGAAAQASFWHLAQPGEGVQVDWWTLYGDPVLDSLEAQALRGNPGLSQSAARRRAAESAVGGARAPLLPQLGLTAGSTRAQASPGGSAASSNTLGVAASWEIDLWGRVAATVDAAEANAQASNADLASARLSLQASVAQSYFALRAAEAQQQLLTAVLAAYDESRTLTRNRVQAGVASPSDTDQAEAQYQSTLAQWYDAHANRAQWEHALAALVGEAPVNFSLETSAQLPEAPAVPLALPAELLQRRPDIAAAQFRVAAANAQLGVAQTAFFPALTLSASAGFRSNALASLISAPNLVWSLGPQLALALFDNGARTAARENALANVDLSAATYREAVITALQEVEDALSSGAALQQQGQAQQLAVAAAQRALAVAENQYRAGIVGYLNVLSAQASLLAGQRSLIDLQRQQLMAVNTLLKNLGGGWAVPGLAD